MIRRFLAVLGAVLMVVVALLVRGAIGDDDAPGGGSSAPDDLVVACPTELERPCREVFGDDAVIEPAATTLDRLTGTDPDVDAWIVSRPWTDSLETASPAAVESVTPVGARTPVAIAIWADRREALGPVCETIDLDCLGEHAGSTFNDLDLDFPERVRVGFPDLSSMTGLDVIAAAGSSYFGGADYASNDFDLDFRTRLTDLQQDVTGSVDPLPSMLTQGPGRLTATVGLRSLLEPQVEANTRQPVDLLLTTSFSELFVVDLDGGADGSRAANGALREALVDAGWSAHEREPDEAVDDGLAARPGVLAALRDLALQVS